MLSGSFFYHPARSLTAAIFCMSVIATAHADTFANGVLTIPTLVIGSATYSNVVISPITLGEVTGYTKGGTRGGVDSYDPNSGLLMIPQVSVGNSTFTNVTVAVPASASVSIGGVTGVDSYAGGRLTIPAIKAGSTLYNDVVLGVNVSAVVRVAGGIPAARLDQYTASSGQLFIPAVQVGSRVYTNVTLTAGPSNILYVAAANPRIGGQITGLTAPGLVLTLIDNSGSNNSQTSQVLEVGYDATGFNFIQPLPYSASAVSAGTFDFFSALVSTQPVGQTCAVTDGFGGITSPSSVGSVQVTCVANAAANPALQGAYRLAINGSAVTKWLAFAPDGTYIFTDIQYPPDPTAGCYGVDYGVYTTTPTTLSIVDALVYLPLANEPAECGFTDGMGNVSGTPTPFTVTGTGQNTAITLTTPNIAFTGTAVPSVAGSIVGAWAFGTGLDQGLTIFGADGTYLIMSTQADPTTGTMAGTGVEYGCYTTTGVTAAGGHREL